MKVWPCVIFTSVKRPTTFWYLYKNWMVFAANGFKDSSQMCVLSVAAVPIIRGHHILVMYSERVSRTSVVNSGPVTLFPLEAMSTIWQLLMLLKGVLSKSIVCCNDYPTLLLQVAGTTLRQIRAHFCILRAMWKSSKTFFYRIKRETLNTSIKAKVEMCLVYPIILNHAVGLYYMPSTPFPF